MKNCGLLSVLLALVCVHINAAPGMHPGSCDDASAKGAANLALEKINHDRTEGYVFHLHRLSNVHTEPHGETGMVFYLTLNVEETNCSVLMKDHTNCVARAESNVPVYGQCKAAIYISKVHRVVRLYKYDCVIRPVPGAKVHRMCPDCPHLVSNENEQVQKTVALALESFNKDSKLNHHFAVLKVNRATAGMAIGMYYNVEFTIQETTCDKSVFPAVKCPKMECEFAHKGFCKGSLFNTPTGQTVSVECDIFEPEAAEREKKLHLLGGMTDHSHENASDADHDHAHDGHDHTKSHDHNHDHDHDHTKSHAVHEATHHHAPDSDHHHTHDHAAGSAHSHAHDHSHDHGHNHDHVHAHHAKAHNHEGDFPNQHHNYTHNHTVHTHDHDHEMALDHDHKHAHLHEHEHHHHHHKHEHETAAHDHPEGSVRMLPAMDPNTPMVLPAFPDTPAAGPEVGVTLPLKPDPQIPGMTEPIIEPFPSKLSAECQPPADESLLGELFAEDPIFKAAA